MFGVSSVLTFLLLDSSWQLLLFLIRSLDTETFILLLSLSPFNGMFRLEVIKVGDVSVIESFVDAGKVPNNNSSSVLSSCHFFTL